MIVRRKAEIEKIHSARASRVEGYMFDEDYYDYTLKILYENRSINEGLTLDAGCGKGAYGIRLAKRGNAVIGADLSIDMLKTARMKRDREKVDFSLLLCDLEKLPLRENTFENILAGFCLDHFKDLEMVIGEFSKLLKTNGRIIIIDGNGSNPVIKLFGTLRELLIPKNFFVREGLFYAG